jgi:glycosyltransferase involved in cell wall biosynthesis
VDVLHSHYRRTTLVGRAVQRPRGSPPLLYTLHLSDMPASGIRRWWADYGDHLHAAAAEGRRWAVDVAGVPADRITLLPHGIHTERFPRAGVAEKLAARRALGLEAGDRVAAFVGRLDDPKNAHWVLDVAAEAREAVPNLKVVFCGAGPHEADLRRQIEERGLAERVRMIGERPDPLEVYQAVDALLLPSLREGFSLVTAEAMSVGVPVIRTRTAGAEELVVEGVTGATTAIERRAFVSAAVAFLADGEALARMGEAAARHVREGFTFERQLRETIAMYRRLAGSAGRTREAVVDRLV